MRSMAPRKRRMDHDLTEAMQAIRAAWQSRILKGETISQREHTLAELERQARTTGATVIAEEIVVSTAIWVKSSCSAASHSACSTKLIR